MKAISNVLTRLRTDAGFSKRKLATVCGICRGVYLLQVEQGKYRPTINFMFLLAKGLGISVTELINCIEEEQKALCQRQQKMSFLISQLLLSCHRHAEINRRAASKLVIVEDNIFS